MAFFETQHVAIRGMAACVPKGISENSTLDIWGVVKVLAVLYCQQELSVEEFQT